MSAELKDRGSPTPDALWQIDDNRSVNDPSFTIDVNGFEGPLDLLLHLAHHQKVDLTRISILELVEQYLFFIKQARALRLELAADYLVMAAWLAYLKSKLLIPHPPHAKDGTGEELAAVLQFRLKRLEAMREAAVKLVNRHQLGRDVFVRGMPEMIMVDKTNQYTASFYDLLTAYTSQRCRKIISHVKISQRTVWSLQEARAILTRLIGERNDWVVLDDFLRDFIFSPADRATAYASSFAASLELVREGKLEIQQESPFQPLYMRGRYTGIPMGGV